MARRYPRPPDRTPRRRAGAGDGGPAAGTRTPSGPPPPPLAVTMAAGVGARARADDGERRHMHRRRSAPARWLRRAVTAVPVVLCALTAPAVAHAQTGTGCDAQFPKGQTTIAL